MTQKIKIEVDVNQKAIKSIDIPEEIDRIEAIKIFMGLANNMLHDIKITKVEKKNGDIITPSKNIVMPIRK